MFYEAFHRLMFPIVVISVIGCVWVAGWSQALVEEANRGNWPALPLPHIKAPPEKDSSAAAGQKPTITKTSFQQVLLKHD